MASDLTTVKEAVRYPWNDGEAGLTIVVGGILTLLSPLVLPGLLVLGYGLRVVESVLEGQQDPPRFDDWRALLVDGVKGAVVLAVYVLLPLLVGTVVVAAITGALGFRFTDPLSLDRAFAVGGLTLVVVLLLAGLVLLATYVAPAALVHLARTRRLGPALEFESVRGLATADAYSAAWLLALGVFAAAAVVLTVLNTAAIGVIVSGFVTFYAFVAMAYLYADGASQAGVELELAVPSEADAEAETDPSAEAETA